MPVSAPNSCSQIRVVPKPGPGSQSGQVTPPLNTGPKSVYLPRMPSNTTRTTALLGLTALAAACASASKFEGMDAEAIYRLGQEKYESEDYSDASEAFDRILLTFPGYAQIAEVAFLYAESEYRAGRYISSAAEYTRFLGDYPAHPRAPEAAVGVCRSNEALSPHSQRDQTFTEQAVTVCTNVARDYQGSEFGAEAERIALEMREKLAKKIWDEARYYQKRGIPFAAITYFEWVLEDYPGTTFAPKSLVGIIEAYTDIGYEDEIASARNRLLTEYPDSPEAKAIGDASANGGGGDSTSGGLSH